MQVAPYPQQIQMSPIMPVVVSYPQQIQPVQMIPVMPVIPQPMIDRFDLNNHNDLLVKQTRSGWCQELMGFEANTEFNIASKSAPNDDIFYAFEDTSCCLRFFCSNLRPFTIHLSKDGGQHVAAYHRPFACPAASCKICCRQSIILEKNGARNGKIIEACTCCVPAFKVLKEDGTHQYNIHYPTCCCGMCIDPCAEGCCNCRIPFYIFVPGSSGETGSQSGKIVKVWGGFSKELFTQADTFELDFPNGIDVDTKLRLLGGVFLLNQLYFEKNGNFLMDCLGECV